MIFHSVNSAHARNCTRVEIPSTPPCAVVLRTGVVDRHIGNPNLSHITISRWPTPMIDHGHRIIMYGVTGRIRLPFGKRIDLPLFELTRRKKLNMSLPLAPLQIEDTQNK